MHDCVIVYICKSADYKVIVDVYYNTITGTSELTVDGHSISVCKIFPKVYNMQSCMAF